MEDKNQTKIDQSKLADIKKQPKNLINLIVILVIFLLITIIVGTAVYLWQKKQNAKIKTELERRIYTCEQKLLLNNQSDEPIDKTDNQPTADSQEKIDDRECIPGEIESLPENFPVGLSFQSFAASGEWGVFNADGTIDLNWRLDYSGPDDTRPTSGVGNWSYDNGILTLSNTHISDGSYSDLMAFIDYGDVYIIPKEYTGFVLGPDADKIEDFFDKKIAPVWSFSNLTKEICEDLKD